MVDRQGRVWKYSFDKAFAVTQGKRKQAFQSAVGDVVSIVDAGRDVYIVGQNGIMVYDGKGVSPWGTVTVLGEVAMPGPVNMPSTMDLWCCEAW